jgi:hypothetical protein
MDNITRNVNNLNRFFSNLNVQNMRLVKPAYDAYLTKASDLHEEFGDLVKEHAATIFGCDEKCIDDCLDPNFISFWEIPVCVSHCRCKNGVITINRLGGGTSWGAGGFLDELYGTPPDIVLGEEEEFLGTDRTDIRRKRVGSKTKGEFNLPELMKYSDYDKKAWSFFKKYQEDI